MARTTLDLDEGVLRALKRRRDREGRPMGAIASELLARALAEEPDEAVEDLQWVAKPMRARVDLEDRDAVWDALEGHLTA
jgi:hypothetical protein